MRTRSRFTSSSFEIRLGTLFPYKVLAPHAVVTAWSGVLTAPDEHHPEGSSHAIMTGLFNHHRGSGYRVLFLSHASLLRLEALPHTKTGYHISHYAVLNAEPEEE